MVKQALHTILPRKKKERRRTGDVSDAILTPFGKVVILVFPGSTWSGRVAGRETPGSGASRAATWL
jgi:hypothetical protein